MESNVNFQSTGAKTVTFKVMRRNSAKKKHIRDLLGFCYYLIKEEKYSESIKVETNTDDSTECIEVKMGKETILDMSLEVFKSFQFFKTVGADTVEPVHLSFVELMAAAYIVSVGRSKMKQTLGQIKKSERSI